MISGIAILTAALLGAGPSSAVLPPDAAALIAGLARPAPASTAYTEVRFAHLLRTPQIRHGQLDYGGPGRLGKRVDMPYAETTTIADGAVDVRREGHPVRHFSLDRVPELQALLAGFGALLGGDAKTLTEFYEVTFAPHGDDWTLTLTPRSAELARHLRAILVDGAGTEPRCFSLQQGSGDSSTMLLGELAKAKLPEPPTPAALATLCHRAAP